MIIIWKPVSSKEQERLGIEEGTREDTWVSLEERKYNRFYWWFGGKGTWIRRSVREGEGMWRIGRIEYREKFLKYVKAIPKNSLSNGWDRLSTVLIKSPSKASSSRAGLHSAESLVKQRDYKTPPPPQIPRFCKNNRFVSEDWQKALFLKKKNSIHLIEYWNLLIAFEISSWCLYITFTLMFFALHMGKCSVGC